MMRLPTVQLAQHPLEGYFYYQWNSTRRRAHIVVIFIATLLTLAVYTAYPLRRLFAAPVAPSAAALRMLQDDPNVFARTASGNDLYVGSSFTTIGGINARGIAGWNGSVWSALGKSVDVNTGPDVWR
jgi:hypothetical protein